MRNELLVSLDECGHEYGCLGAGDGEIREEWRMERPGKSRGSHDDEEERTMGGRFKSILRGQFRKIGDTFWTRDMMRRGWVE